MKSLVVYYSESENTAKLAHVIAAKLGTVERSIETVRPEETTAYDLIVIGSPVHGSRPNAAVMHFIEAMPELPGKKAAAFCTMHLFGDKRVIDIIQQQLEHKGMLFLGGFCTKGLSRLVANFGPRIFNRGRPSPQDLKEADEFAGMLLQTANS